MICTKCDIEKDESLFVKSKSRNGKVYLKKYCNSCHAKQMKIWEKNHPDRKKKKNEKAREQYLKNKNENSEKFKTKILRNRERAKDYYHKNKITRNQKHKELRKKHSQQLSDNHVKRHLLGQGWPPEVITEKLIDFKKKQLFLFRKLNKK